MVSETVVVCLVLPFVPVMVSVCVPLVARLFTVTFIVEVPLPVTEVGLKLTVTRLGTPDAESETDPLNPPVPVTVMVELPELPREIVSEVGDALTE